ncbi:MULTISPECIES: sulfite exporter TauE/SafE family protein [Sphingomonas]|uniref:sulfite exporter TauE/SafE family protein n=1 Tax=Sphingomonas TaxID=13687 RepID=UPI000DEF057D|nr:MULTISPECIES: sulfite exporter TauE/SafE family protein [Sphingomonas]
MLLLAGGFLFTALIYAMVGFGGGSTYTALLVLAGVDYRAVPVISLLCNVLVVTMGTLAFARAGHFDARRSWPLFVLSVPAAALGGRLPVGETLFLGLLALSLLCAGLTMLWQPFWRRDEEPAEHRSGWIEPLAAGLLGFAAGVVGIGGGIFLAPLLHVRRWGSPKAIAATSAMFILVNSLAGLVGQALKGAAATTAVVASYWPLFPAVVAGGAVGALLGARALDPKWVRLVTALLILYVAVRLALRWYAAVTG